MPLFNIKKDIFHSVQIKANYCGPACLQMIICGNNKPLISQVELAKEISTFNSGSVPGIMAQVLTKYQQDNYKAKIIKKLFGSHDKNKEVLQFAYNVYETLVNNQVPIIAINGHFPGELKNIMHYVVIFQIELNSNNPYETIFHYCDPGNGELKTFKGKDLIGMFSNGEGAYIGKSWKNQAFK